VRVAVTDKESRRKSNWKGELELTAKDSLLEVSDLYWVSEDSRLATAGVPRLVESFPSSESEAAARIEVFSAGQDSVQITWAIVDSTKDTLQSLITKIAPTRKIQIHEFTVLLDSLNVSDFTLSFEALGNGRREYRTRNFSVHISGVPSSVTDLELAIRELKYIASGEENRRLRSATPEERERLFRDFWKRRDPTPATEENELLSEYYVRVEYANEQFSTHRKGWETDRGRIYILYGEPTQIERHPFDAESRPYEIWYYHNLNKRFVFVDYSGFGDYTLAGPTWGY
jgi:GWxTD domain-containing protein